MDGRKGGRYTSSPCTHRSKTAYAPSSSPQVPARLRLAARLSARASGHVPACMDGSAGLDASVLDFGAIDASLPYLNAVTKEAKLTMPP